jgi:hypothetical protein
MATEGITILDESRYMNTTDPANPIPSVLVTFQLPDGRVETVSLPEKGYDTTKRDAAVRDRAKKMGPSRITRISF